MVSGTDSHVIVPLASDGTKANIHDNHVYLDLISGLHPETIKRIHFIVEDPPRYDDQKLYDLSLKMGFQLVCPIKR